MCAGNMEAAVYYTYRDSALFDLLLHLQESHLIPIHESAGILRSARLCTRPSMSRGCATIARSCDARIHAVATVDGGNSRDIPA